MDAETRILTEGRSAYGPEMDHMNYLDAVLASDGRVLRAKEATYRGSWKAAGGRSAWFMLRRNVDRLLNMCAYAPLQLSPEKLAAIGESGFVNLGPEDCESVRRTLRSEDLFALIEAAPGGEDGTVLACMRDLRRYATLVEAEMVSRGVVTPELAASPLPAGIGPPPATGSGSQDAALVHLLSALDGTVTLSAPGAREAAHKRAADLWHEGHRDVYGIVAKVLNMDRSVVKSRAFTVAYGVGRALSPQEFYRRAAASFGKEVSDVAGSAPEVAGPAEATEPRALTLAESALLEVLRNAYPEWDPEVARDAAVQAVDRRPGGSVFHQAADASGETYEDVRAAYVARAVGQERDALARYLRLAAALEHALNRHSLDARLGTPDHVVADLIAPDVLRHLDGRSEVQVVEAARRRAQEYEPPISGYVVYSSNWNLLEQSVRRAHAEGYPYVLVDCQEPGEGGPRTWRFRVRDDGELEWWPSRGGLNYSTELGRPSEHLVSWLHGTLRVQAPLEKWEA